MNLPHKEFLRYKNWRDQFLKDYNKISSEEIKRLAEDLKSKYESLDERLLKA